MPDNKTAKDKLNEIQIGKSASAEAAMANDPDLAGSVEAPVGLTDAERRGENLRTLLKADRERERVPVQVCFTCGRLMCPSFFLGQQECKEHGWIHRYSDPGFGPHHADGCGAADVRARQGRCVRDTPVVGRTAASPTLGPVNVAPSTAGSVTESYPPCLGCGLYRSRYPFESGRWRYWQVGPDGARWYAPPLMRPEPEIGFQHAIVRDHQDQWVDCEGPTKPAKLTPIADFAAAALLGKDLNQEIAQAAGDMRRELAAVTVESKAISPEQAARAAVHGIAEHLQTCAGVELEPGWTEIILKNFLPLLKAKDRIIAHRSDAVNANLTRWAEAQSELSAISAQRAADEKVIAAQAHEIFLVTERERRLVQLLMRVMEHGSPVNGWTFNGLADRPSRDTGGGIMSAKLAQDIQKEINPHD